MFWVVEVTNMVLTTGENGNEEERVDSALNVEKTIN